ncbi:alpha-galactosidase [Kineococcus sp. SYSU DK001]|uniref:alpha-galactosidase n=1 Tax=Kineococcus sp. SYSU DK001 TaxID=3383122 RepID=UPI003D7F0D8C
MTLLNDLPDRLDLEAGPRLVHLRAAGVSLALHLPPDRLPTVLHWGADLGDLAPAVLADVLRTGATARSNNDHDVPQPLTVLPGQADGWSGTPALVGSRAGADWTARFVPTDVTVQETAGGGRVEVVADDPHARLSVRVVLELLPTGLVRHRAELRNTAAEGPAYEVGHLAPALPLPAGAEEVLDLAGRWAKERVPQRRPVVVGAHVRENRRGRTGPDAPLVLAAGTPGFSFRSGEVWAQHVAFSGNHRAVLDRQYTGDTVLTGGELLLPGEVRLEPGASYSTPWVYAAHSTDGLDGVAARFHEHLRARPHHPGSPRPVIVNTWEAVYFDHDLGRLTELARAAAEVGAERYVLDDGWFRHRRDDSAGLGDWYVDEDVWPEGLEPLIDVVTGLGMQFGLWVEPEMVNPDSDLARAHPEWILRPADDRLPLPSRQQQVLDLGNPDAFAHVLGRLDALLSENDIAYLKWDHNRDLLEAGHGPGHVPGVHAQTLAVYRLLDELRTRHPGVEIESCSSGGLRVDLGILEHTDRVWGSDCLDPFERQQIQRWTTQVVPPELLGSHVGASPSHTTHRASDLSFRAGTALFAHFGIETDLTRLDPAERAELAAWVALYKQVRTLLHTGRLVRADVPDDSLALHGVVAQDGGEALFAVVQLATPDLSVPGRLRVPGLDDDTEYELTVQHPGDRPRVRGGGPAPWTAAPVRATGRVLASLGLSAPALQPGQLLLLRLTARPGSTAVEKD